MVVLSQLSVWQHAGVHTVLLERGKRWPITPEQDTFATFENPDGRAAWLSPVTVTPGSPPIPIDVFTGILDLPATKEVNGITVNSWAWVGGGSLGNNGLLPQPRREHFERAFPSVIDFDEMDQIYYPRVREAIKPEPIPGDVLATDFYESTRVNLEQAERAGFATRVIPLQVGWDIVREEIEGAKRPLAIDGQSWYGLNSGAKKSLDQNYLAMAEETGFVEILPLHVAVNIHEFRPYGSYIVSANQINTHGEIIAERQFVCKYLFLAAGSMGTSALLVRAKGKGTLPRLNQWVGRRMGPERGFCSPSWWFTDHAFRTRGTWRAFYCGRPRESFHSNRVNRSSATKVSSFSGRHHLYWYGWSSGNRTVSL